MKDRKYERVICKDGFSVSIQAGAYKYSQPRSNEDGITYFSVELGFPSSRDYIIMDWAENPNEPTNTVYGYVPVDQVYLLLTKHGGVVGGDVPLGVPVYGDKSYG